MDTGSVFPGTVVEDTSTGIGVWVTDVNNVKAWDGVEAFTQVIGPPFGTTPSHPINCTNFGFSIPSGATIDGIVASIVQRDANSSPPAWNHIMQLIKGGSRAGTNKGDDTTNRASSALYTFGASNDLWGLTLSPSDVNASNFGVSTSYASSNAIQMAVDAFWLTVYYTPASGGIVLPRRMQRRNSSLIRM